MDKNKNNNKRYNIGLVLLVLTVVILIVSSFLFFASIYFGLNMQEEQKSSLTIVFQSSAEEILESFSTPSFDDTEKLISKVTEEMTSKETKVAEETDYEESADDSIDYTTLLTFDLPDDVSIIEVKQLYDNAGTQEVIALKDWTLQFWVNGTMVCEREIPIPAQMSVGNNFYEKFGNPYISVDGDLVLIQSYTTSEGEQKLDYTILANNCRKIIPTLYRNCYLFQNNNGEYGLAYYKSDEASIFNLAYAGLYFNTMDNDTVLPTPTIIELNDSTVNSVKFGCWASVSYHYTAIYGISARLDVESYGELDIAHVCSNFEPIEVDDEFFEFLDESFSPKEYNERFYKLLQIIDEYINK